MASPDPMINLQDLTHSTQGCLEVRIAGGAIAWLLLCRRGEGRQGLIAYSHKASALAEGASFAVGLFACGTPMARVHSVKGR